MYRGSFKFEEVAIKEVPGISFNKARMLLKHPNIVAYLDIRIETVSERSMANLTMELFACSLEDHIDGAENSKRITIVEKDVLLQCFKGFSYIHSLDIGLFNF